MGKIFEKEKIDKELYKLCKKSKVMGANVALFNGEEILYTYNYGYINKESGLKSTNDSMYMIGSNTKTLTALGIFKLIEQQKISLEDDIRKYIPEFEVKSYFEQKTITIEHLLMHRSGLVSDLYNIIFDCSKDYHDVIEELKYTYLTAPPGQMFSYSNVGYTVLGIIIERVSGLAYAEYIQKVIGEPLGIGIHFLEQEDEKKQFQSVLSLCYDKKGRRVEDLVATIIPAGSNTYMSTGHFVKIGQVFLNKEHTILKKETLEWMEQLNVREAIDKQLLNVGYGLIHNYYDFGENVGMVLGHGGDTSCHHSMFNYIPGLGIGVVVVTNSEQAVQLSRTLGEEVLTKYLRQKGYMDEECSLVHQHVEASCEEYIGRYATQIGHVDVTRNRKKELVTKISKIPVKLLPCEDGYLQCYPNGLICHLPPIKKVIKGLRIKLVPYGDAEVVILEQTEGYCRSKGIAGCRYQETMIPKSFYDACGKYKVMNVKFGKRKKWNALSFSLSVEQDMVKMEAKVQNTKSAMYLQVLDDTHAITQGFGRNAKEMMEITKDGEDIYVRYAGMVLKKIRG